jgi:hypothetical protein
VQVFSLHEAESNIAASAAAKGRIGFFMRRYCQKQCQVIKKNSDGQERPAAKEKISNLA